MELEAIFSDKKVISKLGKIKFQLKEYIREKNYINHYLQNCVRIAFGISEIDYKSVSHNNKLIHSCFSHHRIL